MGKKERLQKRVARIDNRFIDKVEKGKKGTDMDIAMHEARIQRLADKGGFAAPFMAKSPLNNGKYNKVNVQDLQDMGEVKKNKKGKYVVNENPTTSQDTLYIPKNTKSWTGKNIKVGDLIDESDYEDISNIINKE